MRNAIRFVPVEEKWQTTGGFRVVKFFDFFYTREGRGIDKDEPRKTGMALFLDIAARDGWDVLKLTAMLVVCALPVVTIPPALAAYHSALMRIVRDQPGDAMQDFRSGWRKNWKQAYACGLPALLIMGALRFAMVFYATQFGGGTPLFLLYIALLVICGVAWIYLFPLLTTVSLRARDVCKNALLLGIGRAPRSLPALLGSVLLFWCAALLPLGFDLLGFFIATALVSLVCDLVAWGDICAYVLQDSDKTDAEG